MGTVKRNKDAENAHQLHQDILSLKHEIDLKCIALGVALQKMHDTQAYRLLGHDTFPAYLSSDDVSISHTSGYRYMTVARVFAPLLANPDCPITAEDISRIGVVKLEEIAPLVAGKDEETVISWLHEAQANSVRQLESKVREAQGEHHDEVFAYLEERGFQVAALAGGLPRARAPLDSIQAIRAICDDVEAYLQEPRQRIRRVV